jgi:hypothetical protein
MPSAVIRDSHANNITLKNKNQDNGKKRGEK